MSLKELQERRHKIALDMRAMLDEAFKDGGGLSPDAKAKFEAMDADVVKMDEEIRVRNRMAEIDSTVRNAMAETDRREWKDAKRGISKADRSMAVRAWALGQHAPTRWADAARKCGLDHLNPEMQLGLHYRGADDSLISVTTDSTNQAQGVSASQINPLQTIDTAMKTFGGVRRISRVVTTANGMPLTFATVDDTTDAVIVGQSSGIGTLSPDFRPVTINTFKYTSQFVKASIEFMQDVGFDFEDWIFSQLGVRIARGTNRHFTTGTGSGQPLGVVTATTNWIFPTTGVAGTAINTTNLISLVHQVDPLYRPGAYFMFHDSILKGIKSLTDTQGRPLWLPGITAGEPDTLLGYRYEVNNHMTTVTTGTAVKWAIFGDFSKFVVRDVLGMTAVRVNERFIDTGEVGFVALSRHGSGPIASTADITTWPWAVIAGSTT